MAELEVIEGAISDIQQTEKNLKCSVTTEENDKTYFSMYIENPATFEMPNWALEEGRIVKIGYSTTRKEYNGKEMTFRNIKKARLMESSEPKPKAETSFNEAIDAIAEDDGTDFNPAEYEAELADVPVVDQDGNPTIEIDSKLDEATTTEAMLMNSIYNKLSNYDWFKNMPFEEKQKYAVSLYIEINTQRFTRWRKS